MKLHLPKRLAAAVIAALLAVPSAFATTLSDAVLSMDGFTSDNIESADGWTLTNVQGSDTGMYTVQTNQRAELVSDAAWQTMAGTRSTWSAIVTFNINSLSTDNTILVQAAGATGVGEQTVNGSKTLKGVWQNNTYGSPTIASLADYADANGNVTVGVVYDGQATGENKGTIILVGSQAANETGLKGADASSGNAHILLSNRAGVTYSNLYLFSGAVSTADMQAMMSQLSTVNNLTWAGTADSHVWSLGTTATPWLKDGEPAVFTAKDTVTFGANAEGVSDTVTVEGFVNSTSVTVNGNYTLEGSGTVSAGALAGTGKLTLGDNVTVAITQAPTLAAIGGSGRLTVSGLNQNASATELHLADDWAGVVKLENLTVTDTDLSSFSKNGSVVELNGVSGYLKNYSGGTCAVNLKLTDYGSKNAFAINNGAAASMFTFSGKLTGNGTFATETNADAAVKEDFLFAGDLTGFEGNFSRTQAHFNGGDDALGNNKGYSGILQFGTATADAYQSSATDKVSNIAGTGNITSSSVVRFNYADDRTLGIDNDTIKARYIGFNRDGGTANYEVSADMVGYSTNAADNTLRVYAGTTVVKGGVSNFGNVVTGTAGVLEIAEGGTLTAGNGFTLEGTMKVSGGTVTIGTATIGTGKEATLVQTGGTVTFGGTITNNGTLNLSGSIAFDTSDDTQYEIKTAGTTTWSDVENQQGFEVMQGATYYAVKGGTVQGDFTLGEGVTRADDGYVFVLENSVGKIYHVNAAVATLSAYDNGRMESLAISEGVTSTTLTVTGGNLDFDIVDSKAKVAGLVLAGGNATVSSGGQSFFSNVTVKDGSTLSLSATDAFVYEGTAHSKTITVEQGGELACGNKRISLGGVYDINIAGGTISGAGDGNGALDFFRASTVTATGNTGLISAAARLRGVAVTVDVTGNTDQLTISGVMTGAGSLVKTGEGTLKLTGKSSYTGGTVVEAGTLLVSTGGETGALAGTLTVKAGGKVTLEAGDALGWGTSQHVSTLNLEGGNLHVTTTGQANQTFANTTLNLTGGTITGVSGSNIDLYSGSSTVHAIAADGATAENPTVSTVSGATLSLREASTTFTVDENAKLVLESGLKSGNKGSESFANALVVEGAGTLVLSGAGTYQGGTTINGGTVVAGNNAALGTGAVTLVGGALEVVENVTIGNTVTMTGGELTVNGTASNVTANGGSVTIGDNGSVTSLTANDDVTVSGNVDASTIGIAAQKHVTVDSITKDEIQFTAAEDGKVEVANTNTEGSIQYRVGEAAAKVTADSLVAKSASAVTVANQLAVKSISNEGAGALVINGEVAGLESIIAESGDITLNKVNAEIQLNELSVGSKIVRVNTALADGGAAESTIEIATDGTISASTGGTLYANLTLLSGSTLDLDGVLTLGSTLTLDAQGGINLGSSLASEVAALEAGDSVTLIKAATGTILDYAGVNYNGAASAYFANVGEGYQIVADGTHVAIQKTGSDPVVPEPTTGTLGLLALAGLMARRRRK